MEDKPVNQETLISYFKAKQKVGYYSLILDECRYKIRRDPEKSLIVLAKSYDKLGLEHELCFEFIGDAILHLIDDPETLSCVEADENISRMKTKIGMTPQYYDQMKGRALSFWKNEMPKKNKNKSGGPSQE